MNFVCKWPWCWPSLASSWAQEGPMAVSPAPSSSSPAVAAPKPLNRDQLWKALRLNKYIKQMPLPKQAAFLLLPQREAFFGGAGGPGKSSALLMGALQDVHVPG